MWYYCCVVFGVKTVHAKLLIHVFNCQETKTQKKKKFPQSFLYAKCQKKQIKLCYGAGASERALVWLGGERLFHDGAPGAAPDLQVLLQRFERAGGGLPAEVRREVLARIREYAARPVARRSGYRRAAWQQRDAQA